MRYTLVLWALVVCGGVSIVLGEHEVSDANSKPVAVVTSISDDLSFDENGKLKSFHLLFPLDSPNCPAATYTPRTGFESHAIAGEALDLVFPDYQAGDCVAACVERGTDQTLAGYTMPHFHYDGSVEDSSFDNWFTDKCGAIEVCLMNYLIKQRPLQLYWIKPETGEAHFQKDLEYGERNTHCFRSYLGHKFEVKFEDGVLDAFTVEHILVKAIGKSKPPDSSSRSFEEEIVGALNNEWKRHYAVKRTFSPLGFAKGKLPNDVFAAMGSFFYNNRHNKIREEWGGRGVFVNWWETEVSFIQIPWHLKREWQIRLADLVSAWAGVPVEQTMMYGLRQYEDGARLLTHVDRTPTHAVSLIVNVAQGNLTEPWPVEVHDHADRLHEVLMEPGDIVYYESAKNLHGRNRPLRGNNGYYVNLFTHYRPIGDGDTWHQVLNQTGVPAPLLEATGECHLDSPISTIPPLGQVQCDDQRLGSHLSPSLLQAKTPEDLINWWRRTGPNYEGVSSPNSPPKDHDEL